MTPVPIQPRRVAAGEIGVGAVVAIGVQTRRALERLSNAFEFDYTSLDESGDNPTDSRTRPTHHHGRHARGRTHGARGLCGRASRNPVSETRGLTLCAAVRGEGEQRRGRDRSGAASGRSWLLSNAGVALSPQRTAGRCAAAFPETRERNSRLRVANARRTFRDRGRNGTGGGCRRLARYRTEGRGARAVCD